MKLVHVITRCARGGAATLLLSISRELQARGHEVSIASGPSEGPEGSLEPEVRASGVGFLSLPDLVREASPIRDLRTFSALVRLLRQSRFDLVHTHTSKAGVLGRWAARAAGCHALVHSPHGHVFSADARIPGVTDRPGLQRLFYLVERLSSGLAARTVALTEIERRDLVRLQIARADHTVVVPNGLADAWVRDPLDSRPSACERWELDPTVSWIGVVGRLAAEKGHDLVLDAFARTAATRPRLRLLVVGDGAERPALEARVTTLGLGDRVRFLGSVANVREVYPVFDLLVQGSHYEAFGLVLLEAMACGCPVIATRVGGVPEVIEDGVTGRLVPPGDPVRLAATLAAALDRPEQGRELARAARLRVSERFTLSRVVDRLESLYREVRRETAGTRAAATRG